MIEKDEMDTAYNSMIIRVVVPFKDIPMILNSVKELSIILLEVQFINAEVTIIELMIDSAFSLYALGKMVSYLELSKNK